MYPEVEIVVESYSVLFLWSDASIFLAQAQTSANL